MPSPSLMDFQQTLQPAIETALKASFEVHNFSHSPTLKDMLVYHMGWAKNEKTGGHGKRIRPLITLLCTGACDAPIENALPAATAIEFLHNFTLIHDDIEDKSPHRHGRPTLWTQWGIAQAINAGDALFGIAQLTMLDLVKTTDEVIANQAIRRLNQVCLQLTQGQHLDIAFESEQKVDTQAYLTMIAGKTGALIALSATMGGLVAYQSQDHLALLAEFGESLGLAFQIQDDILGIWGDSKTIGKSTASDILTHKKTLPILFGLQHCPEFQKAWQKQDVSHKQVERMSVILSSCGAQAYTRSQVNIYTKQAIDALEHLFSHKNAYAQALFDLTEKLLNRDF